MQDTIDRHRRMIHDIHQSLINIEENIDGLMLKHSIDEKLVQKEQLQVN
jgi:hypothetical protein